MQQVLGLDVLWNVCNNLSVFNKNCKQVSLTFNYWFSDNTEQICPPDKTSQREKDGHQKANRECNMPMLAYSIVGGKEGGEGEEGWRKEIHGGSELHILLFTKDEQHSSNSICQLNFATSKSSIIKLSSSKERQTTASTHCIRRSRSLHKTLGQIATWYLTVPFESWSMEGRRSIH